MTGQIKVIFKYKWLFNRADRLGRFYCTYIYKLLLVRQFYFFAHKVISAISFFFSSSTFNIKVNVRKWYSEINTKQHPPPPPISLPPSSWKLHLLATQKRDYPSFIFDIKYTHTFLWFSLNSFRCHTRFWRSSIIDGNNSVFIFFFFANFLVIIFTCL